jgi:hypothetical protein
MEVDLGTSLPSGVPESRCPPCSTTLQELPGGQALGWTAEWSSMDQDDGSTETLGNLGILTDRLPCKQPD